ncbi:Hypothetical predicted protein [Marmota monax]|uniref:Uncharacterized protein n=1 Tax=Marmota monax TaxID=9995 RepID=A0A5E4BUA0_MARMO|nr:hypothetical protein GHT09_001926 [Marmota monax]VTJ73193.1 Hypothetical predicted protein [Marmota monax]
MQAQCGWAARPKKKEGEIRGLRCYAKFHRNRKVTRRKGRCVEPETANGDQGSFINV